MRVHKVRKFLASKRGEVLQTQRQAELDLSQKGSQKPLGGALLQTLIARSAGQTLIVAPKRGPGRPRKGGAI